MLNSRIPASSLLLTVTLIGSTALAAEPAAGAPSKAKTETAASATPAAGVVPKDPKGVKGISPLWEAIVVGDAALVAHDSDTAIQRYTEGLKSDPHNPWGHYRLAQAQLAKGQLDEAQASLQTAVDNAKEDAVVKAKALFLLADLAERRNKLDDANAAWAHYSEHIAVHKDVKSFPATASERQRRIAARQDAVVKYGEVQQRIKAREAEITAKAMSDAQKQK